MMKENPNVNKISDPNATTPERRSIFHIVRNFAAASLLVAGIITAGMTACPAYAADAPVVKPKTSAATCYSVGSLCAPKGDGTIMYADTEWGPAKKLWLGLGTGKVGGYLILSDGFGEKGAGIKCSGPLNENWTVGAQFMHYDGDAGSRDEFTVAARSGWMNKTRLAIDYQVRNDVTLRLDQLLSNKISGSALCRTGGTYKVGMDFLTGRNSQIGLYGNLGNGWTGSDFSTYYYRNLGKGYALEVDLTGIGTGNTSTWVFLDFSVK